MNEVKRTERGWAGHFICSNRCKFRRNTLLEYGDIKLVVSTVGNMFSVSSYDKYEEVAIGKDYETYVFFADENDPYLDADVSRTLYEFCDSYKITKTDETPDLTANKMHEDTVVKVIKKLLDGRIYNETTE